MKTPPERDGPSLEARLDAWVRGQGLVVDAETQSRVTRYLDLLDVWNQTVNLTGDRNRHRLLLHHVADSLAPLEILPKQGRVIDIGSGAGLPGLVLACSRPSQPFTLVESRARRVTFLREACRVTGLTNVAIMHGRAEDHAALEGLRGTASAVIGRAVRIDQLVTLGAPMLGKTGLLISMQTDAAVGPKAADAINKAGLVWARSLAYELPSGARHALVVLERA